ncbi:MAG: hypothetical protein ACYC5A_02730 [Thermoleophilia bacterium]
MRRSTGSGELCLPVHPAHGPAAGQGAEDENRREDAVAVIPPRSPLRWRRRGWRRRGRRR